MISSIVTRAVWFLVFVGAAYLIYRTGGFNAETFAKVSGTLDTRGGNIVILTVFTFLFFFTMVGFGYYMLGMIQNKTLTPDNGIALMILTGVSNTGFAGFGGALIQLLGGSSREK